MKTLYCDIVHLRQRRKEILCDIPEIKIILETLRKNISLKYLSDILNIAKRARPPRFVLMMLCDMWTVDCGASHAMFIVTCGETSDPHPRGVNITRPCRAQHCHAGTASPHPPQTFHTRSPLNKCNVMLCMLYFSSPPLSYLFICGNLILDMKSGFSWREE